MASQSIFDSLPPFPENVRVADISKVSLARLVADSELEAQAVLDACRKLGFFLLDLAGDPMGEDMIQEVDAVYEVARKTMHLSLEEKQRYQQDAPKSFLGYKQQGAMKTETGAPDRCEFFNVSQDDLLGNTKPERPTPEPIHTKRPLLESYLKHGQVVLTHILRALATQLGLPQETFRELQAPTRASGTVLRLIRYPPSVIPEEMRTGLLPHTDFGSVTLLVNVLGGLQVLAPEHEPEDEDAWQWVRPQPGCLIVNMGDVMVEWTGGVLRSNMHRVTYSPGEQRFAERFSIAMLVRPHKEASMKRLVGGRIPSVEEDKREGLEVGDGNEYTAYEWELKKSMALKAGKDCAKSRGGRELKPLAVA